MRLFAGGSVNLLVVRAKHYINFQTALTAAFRMKSTSTLDLYNSLVVKERDRKAAVIDHRGKTSYSQLKVKSDAISRALKRELKAADAGGSQSQGQGQQQHVSLLCGNNSSYVQALLAIWRAGKVAIPLCQSHPAATLDYYIADSQSSCVIVENEEFKSRVEHSSAQKVLLLDDLLSSGGKIDSASDEGEEEVSTATTTSQGGGGEDAMILYTSGTTGSPKGVVITADNIVSQVENMVANWKWTRSDCLLHVLPLHHVHGVVNCLLTPLTVGATIIMESKFDAERVWEHLLHTLDVNVFMAVPTIYVKLIQAHGSLSDEIRPLVKRKLVEKMRLMVSGSAALPTPVLNQWLDISGHTLLERYGMTEIGMALTNPYNQPDRKPGHVGQPFPNVEARIVAAGTEDDVVVQGHYKGSHRVKQTSGDSSSDDLVGDLQVKGPSVFRCYYNRPEATAKEFTSDGWFKTGDTAQFYPESGSYKILGRTSVDIIKSGGYKIGALDVERVLLEHPLIREVAVVGVADDTWGQRVGVVLVAAQQGATLELAQVNDWAKDKLPKYCLPTLARQMDEIPKNAMGKVNKKELVKVAFP